MIEGNLALHVRGVNGDSSLGPMDSTMLQAVPYILIAMSWWRGWSRLLNNYTCQTTILVNVVHANDIGSDRVDVILGGMEVDSFTTQPPTHPPPPPPSCTGSHCHSEQFRVSHVWKRLPSMQK